MTQLSYSAEYLGNLMIQNCSDAALRNLMFEARNKHQSIETIAKRQASNWLRSMKLQKDSFY